MKSDLEICIEYFSEELEILESLIQTCISEEDFQGAYHNSVAKHKIIYQLTILNTLKDKNYNKKRFLKENIERLKVFLNSLEQEASKEHWKAQLNLKIEQLKKLQSETTPYGIDTQVLVDELNNLLDHTSVNITLIFKEKPALKLQFYLKGKDLILNLLEGIEQVKLKSFLHLGFKLSNDQLQLKVPEFSQNKINEVVEICSRIVYEGCYFLELDKEMKLICD